MSDTVRLQVMEFIQTERTGWITKLPVKELVSILPARPPEQLNFLTETNRPISKPHLQGIISFLENTLNWALPGIILAVDPGHVERNGEGRISLPKEHLRILDGQHRVQALSECIVNARLAVEQGRSEASRSNDLGESEIPLAIFEVADVQDQQQMFAWFARSKPIEAATREWFDRSDPFNNAAKSVMQQSATLRDRVDHIRSKTRPESRTLLTVTELKEIAATIALGFRRYRQTDGEQYASDEQQEKLQEQMVQFLDDFLPSCRQHYQRLEEEDRNKDNFHFERRNTYALDPQAIRLFANCWARTEIDRNQNTDGLKDAIGRMNLNRSDPGNDFFKRLELVNDSDRYTRITDRAWANATQTIMQDATGE